MCIIGHGSYVFFPGSIASNPLSSNEISSSSEGSEWSFGSQHLSKPPDCVCASEPNFHGHTNSPQLEPQLGLSPHHVWRCQSTIKRPNQHQYNDQTNTKAFFFAFRSGI